MNHVTTHEMLVAARNLIDREGHYRGSWSNGRGYCIHSAIGAVTADYDFGPSTIATAHAASDLMQARGYTTDWNDAPGRTKAEVLAAFDEAVAETAQPPADPFVGRASFREAVAQA